MKRYRLTLFFVVTAFLVTAVAAVAANVVIGRLAQAKLTALAADKSVEAAQHMTAMIGDLYTTHAPDPQQPMTLDFLLGTKGLRNHAALMLKGFDIVKFNLFDLNAKAVWSTDPVTLIPNGESPQYSKALAGGASSKVERNLPITDLAGERRSLDIVETYVPLRASPDGPVIGAVGIYSDMTNNVSVLAQEAQRAVLWATVASMGGLFLVLVGFVVVADVVINRSQTRERALVETQLAERGRAEELAVQHATAMEEANRELETFSHSVSHDLRAPLRGMDGFSQALLEDYGEKLDEQGRHYLQRVRAGAQHMGQLIDDLLQLSRVTRSVLQYENVDLTAVARSVVSELQSGSPERQVEWIIADGLVAKGDGRLLRLVLENVLGNAWKYTSKQPRPRIELGEAHLNGQRAYLVRDNGAGFDMAYVAKLFTPFQRLHSPNEFEGTGVGLATVQRIIRRHGGQVWAEGAVGDGATFYFTLCGKGGAE